jgi:hypothetical protein
MDSRRFVARPTEVTVLPEGDRLFSEVATHVRIEDESAGEFLEIEQSGMEAEAWKIRISPEEWPALRQVIDEMIVQCVADKTDAAEQADGQPCS